MKEPIIRTHNREIDDLFERYRRAPGSHVFAPLADAYRKLGLIEEALDICARGLSANPRYASGYVVQGKCQFDAGRADRAEESFKKVLEFDPQNLVALRYLGIIRSGCGDTDGARTYFEHILVLDPDDKDIRQRLEAVREIPSTVSATTLVDEIEEVLESDPPRAEVAAAAAPKREEAAPHIEPAPVAASADDDAVMDLPDVRDDFEGAPISLGDESATTEYIATVTLADIFASQGYTAKAMKIYQDVLRRQPDNPDVRNKMAALEKGERVPHPHEESTPEFAEIPAPAPIATPAAKSPSPAMSAPTPAAPAGAAIDEGRSYEQFKRWLRTVSD